MSKIKKDTIWKSASCVLRRQFRGIKLPSRRKFLGTLATASAGAIAGRAWAAAEAEPDFPRYDKAQIAITLDLEMSRNFPNWEDSHWDYEKGNLNQEAKDYTVEACRRVKERGGLIHTFVVGQVLHRRGSRCG